MNYNKENNLSLLLNYPNYFLDNFEEEENEEDLIKLYTDHEEGS